MRCHDRIECRMGLCVAYDRGDEDGAQLAG